MSNGREERERKFLIKPSFELDGYPSMRFVQGYLVITDKVEVRVRSGPAGRVVTFKGSPTDTKPGEAIKRREHESPLPDELLAYDLLEACDGRILVKTRHSIAVRAEDDEVDHWVVDVYHGDNTGLVVAEYEYEDENEIPRFPLPIPAWIDKEVTHLRRYFGQSLVSYPFKDWTEPERSE